MQGPAGAVVNHVATQCQDQERLLEEAKQDLEEAKQDLEGAKWDLEVFKKAYYILEQEKQALSDEIHQLKVRLFPPTYNVKPFADVACHKLIQCLVT